MNANWGVSFKIQGWSTCGPKNKFITGFYRNSVIKDDGLDRLEQAKCCPLSPKYFAQNIVCKNANWERTFNMLVPFPRNILLDNNCVLVYKASAHATVSMNEKLKKRKHYAHHTTMNNHDDLILCQ